jgi:hypothetical protein
VGSDVVHVDPAHVGRELLDPLQHRNGVVSYRRCDIHVPTQHDDVDRHRGGVYACPPERLRGGGVRATVAPSTRLAPPSRSASAAARSVAPVVLTSSTSRTVAGAADAGRAGREANATASRRSA